jgi:hypothetical protein
MALCWLLAGTAWAVAGAWPPFLPARGEFAEELARAVERTWAERTFTRAVRGRPVRAPLPLYVALIDTPDVTAAAGRHLALARHHVRWVGDGVYEADDREGSRGLYRAVVRGEERRVVFSWGEHVSALVGAIRGDALSVLAFTPGEEAIEQELTAHVRIEHPVLAALARVLIVLFGALADRRLGEGMTIVSRVAEWAVTEPEAFCRWLDGAPVPVERQGAVRASLGRCP